MKECNRKRGFTSGLVLAITLGLILPGTTGCATQGSSRAAVQEQSQERDGRVSARSLEQRPDVGDQVTGVDDDDASDALGDVFLIGLAVVGLATLIVLAIVL